MRLGKEMRGRRKSRPCSQGAQEALGLTFQQIQKYEKGINRMGASRLQQAADLLGVPVPFFFEGGDAGPYRPDVLSPSYIDDFISNTDRLRLAKAFMQIPRSSVRHRIVKLVQEIAGDDDE
jgi:transcriptional regulator with XRE-family HTH domain